MGKFSSAVKSFNFGKWLCVIIALCLLVSLALVIAMGFSQSTIDTTFYQVKNNKINSPVRIVMLSDLHLREFGKDNCELVKKINHLQPDIITVAGDMNIAGVKDYSIVINLLSQLVNIAPVYYSYGNHEYEEILFDNSKIGVDIKNAGATVVNNSYVTVDVNGNTFAIGGFCAPVDNFDNAAKFLTEYEKSEDFKLLLCHHAECFESVMQPYPVDLAFSGHAHGGQIILPILGGLYAPGQGILPDLTDRMTEACGSTLIISRGLGSGSIVPRFCNNPEIVIADLSSN